MESTSLYDQDYQLWLEKIAHQLAHGHWDEVDVVNLVEEIQDMGKSQKQALMSNLTIILLHLLKYKYQPTRRSNSGLASILEHRQRIEQQLLDSPSLKPYLEQIFEKAYANSRRRAQVETGLPLTTFPMESPFTIDEVLDVDFLPID